MSYRGKIAEMQRVAALRARSRRGLLGLGADDADQAPVVAPTATQTNPVLSTASVMASQIMLRMASVPRKKRLGEMVSILNAAQRGLGDSAKRDFLRLSATRPASQLDQTMFDVITVALSGVIATRLLALKATAGGLGQTVASVQGRTSQGVEDANSVMCSTVLPVGSLFSGLYSQLASGGSSTSGITGAQAGGQIAGCNAGQLALQAQTAQSQAQAAQSAGLQQLQMQQHQEQMTFQYLLLGGGGLVIATVLYAVLKK